MPTNGSTHAHALQHVLGVGIDIQLTRLGLRNIQGRNLRDVLILALTLLLLELEGDTANRTALDTLHQVGGETGDLVAQTLRGDDGNLIAETLVGFEVEGELGVVPLDHHLSGALDGLIFFVHISNFILFLISVG